MSLDSIHKKLNEFHKKLWGLKNLIPKTKKKENLKANVSDDSGDFFNVLSYIYKQKYEEKNDDLNKDDIKKFDYKKLRLTDD